MPLYASVAELPSGSEKFPTGGRTFRLIPEGPITSESAWTFLEEFPDGTLGESTDVMGASGPLGFVKFHLGVSVR